MKTKIFVNLPVEDLERSKSFFGKLGYRLNPQFIDEMAACKEFTKKPIADATEVLTCLSVESKAKVDELVEAALGAGATEAREPMGYGHVPAEASTISTETSGRSSGWTRRQSRKANV